MFIGFVIAAPVTDVAETTTEANDSATLYEVIEVIEEIPAVVALVENTEPPSTETSEHKVAKRSLLRGDNPENDLLANLDGLNYENGLNSLEGRRIKFLPTWVG